MIGPCRRAFCQGFGTGAAFAFVPMHQPSPLLFRCRSVFRFAFLALLALVFFLGKPAHAQPKNDAVTINLTAEKVVANDGKESLESADKAKPGDLIQYDAAYRNTTKGAVKN